ncbi:MAG TPA: citrate synthase [Pyrinomonadaceae bacterium]|jgi:citrate synthase|nr:citrate synthase [Pyrinomonadaceae bacterium]
MDKAKDNAAATAKSPAGLEGVVAATSSIGDVDGINGVLIYQGLNIHDLAEHSNFEEVVFLLWHGRLPKQAELDELRRTIAENQTLPDEIMTLLREAPRDADPMDVLRTAVSALAFYDKGAKDISREGALRTATRLTGQLPVLVAAIDRIRNGNDPLTPKPELNIATNFLYMLKGEMPSERDARIFDAALVLHADHELNASTFTGRVVAATLADMYGAITAAIAALSGPLHGGANTNVMKMLLEIGSVDKAEGWITDALAQKKKIMGFGHRVYRTEDPRATHLRQFSKEMGETHGDSHWFEISRKLEEVMQQEKGLYPNVDFYSGSTYYMMGIPLDLFTPIFAVSRISGWTGHILEQYANNRLIRPRAEYTGPRDVAYVPIDER